MISMKHLSFATMSRDIPGACLTGMTSGVSRSRYETDPDTIITASSAGKQQPEHRRGCFLRQLRGMFGSIPRRVDDDDDESKDIDNSDHQCKNVISNAYRQRTVVGLITLVAAYTAYKKIWQSRRFSPGMRQPLTTRLWKTLLALVASSFQRPEYTTAQNISFGHLRQDANSGQVQRALLGPSHVVYKTHNGTWRRATLPSHGNASVAQWSEHLMEMLAKGGCTDVMALTESVWSKLATPALAALPFVYLALVFRLLKNLHNNGGDGEDFLATKLLSHKGDGNQQKKKESYTSFADVAGLDKILPEVQEIVAYLKHPSGYHALGAGPPRGVLLFGSPGAGKTLLARAMAGEADCDAFLVCSGSDFCEMYVGRGAARVRSLFQEARRVAIQNHTRKCGNSWWGLLGLKSTTTTVAAQRNGGQPHLRPPSAIIFIDELDALAKSRSYGSLMNGNDERDQTLNQLLTEMDGFFDSPSLSSKPLSLGSSSSAMPVTIIVVGATNRAEILDPAILRRFDRQLFVPLPDPKGRKAILQVHAAKTECRFSTIHWDYLAELTSGFSGSDLKQIVNDAALLAVREKSKRVEQGHLLQAIQRAKSMKVQNRQHLGSSAGQSLFASPSSSFRLGGGTIPQNGSYSMRDSESPLMWFPPEIGVESKQ